MQDVQFEMLKEQVKHGLSQEMQLELTRNFVVSAQEVQVVRLLHARHGDTQGSQVKEVVLAKVVEGQRLKHVPLYKYELL